MGTEKHPSMLKVAARRFPVDMLLRRLNPPFRIKSRPRKGEAVWERGGKSYTQSQALAILRREVSPEELRKAEEAVERWFEENYRA